MDQFVPRAQFRDEADLLKETARRAVDNANDGNQFFGRIDHHLSDSDRFFGRLMVTLHTRYQPGFSLTGEARRIHDGFAPSRSRTLSPHFSPLDDRST